MKDIDTIKALLAKTKQAFNEVPWSATEPGQGGVVVTTVDSFDGLGCVDFFFLEDGSLESIQPFFE